MYGYDTVINLKEMETNDVFHLIRSELLLSQRLISNRRLFNMHDYAKPVIKTSKEVNNQLRCRDSIRVGSLNKVCLSKIFYGML